MHLRMIYSRLFDLEGKDVTIGGIQTYLRELSECAAEIGLESVLYQCASRPFIKDLGSLSVHGVVTKTGKGDTSVWQALYRNAMAGMNGESDILLFGSDTLSVPTKYSRAILVQHGIHWDIPSQNRGRFEILNRFSWFRALRIARRHLRHVQHFENCRNRVCVDYNFQNWHRTFSPNQSGNYIRVIPNYAPIFSEQEIKKKLACQSSQVRVLFARRFVPYRGTRLIAEVISALLPVHPNLLVTFAGDGPDRDFLIANFQSESRIEFRKVPWEERMLLSYEHDIVVVPSLGSEGTSLSLVEAMASGCAVIASDVGGMTNMVLDEFNGLLIPPSTQSLHQALSRLIQNPLLRRELAYNGYTTARCAFSKEKWMSKWKSVFDFIKETPAKV